MTSTRFRLSLILSFSFLSNMHFAIPVAAALLTSAHGASAAYNLVKEFSGSSFFDGWEFYGNYDNLTNGAYLSP